MNAAVKDVMSTHVIAVTGTATYKEMAARFREMHVSAFPVLDDDSRVIGVVSESDLLTKAALGEIMPDAAGGMMRSREQAKAAGWLIGIVSRADVLSVYGKPDGDIRRDILRDVIGGEFGANPDRFTVTVSDGIVTLEGAPETAGVVAVRDRLAYPTAGA